MEPAPGQIAATMVHGHLYPTLSAMQGKRSKNIQQVKKRFSSET
jgi:hypothetical protein